MFPDPSQLGPTGAPLPHDFGRYRILRRLGQGGMGSVFLAEDTRLGRKVALKLPIFGPGDTSELRLRFEQEARAAATLEHPNLCRVYDNDEVDGHPYLTMEYIEGASLAQVIASQGSALTPQKAAAIAAKLAMGLQEAHARKVIHRDLKPANVMIRTLAGKKEPVIVDFGLARLLVDGNPDTPKLTRTGHAMGTLAYMSPEQLRGEPDIGPATDVFALGVILYEMLAGEPPFQGPGLAVAAQVLNAQPDPPSRLRPGIDPALEAICLKAMSKAPKDRHASMSEFAAELGRYVRGARAGLSGETPVMAAPGPEVGRRPGLVIAGVAMIVLSGSAIAYILMPGRGPRPEAAPPAVAKDVGWVELFNHKDISGWADPNPGVNPSEWVIEDGCLVGRLVPGSVVSSLATVRKDYRNFRLRVVSRRTDEMNRVVKGRWRVKDGQWWGYTAITNGPKSKSGKTIPVGSLIRGDGANVGFINRKDANWVLAPESAANDGDWITLEMTVVGNRVITTVNGQPGADLNRTEPPLPSGAIGFTCHDMPIRDVLVKEFSDDDAQAEIEAGLVDYRLKLQGRWSMTYDNGGQNTITFLADGTCIRPEDNAQGKWTLDGRKIEVDFPPAFWSGELAEDGLTLRAINRKGNPVSGTKIRR